MMYEFYCETCKKWCDKWEVELEEVYECEWEEVHITCKLRVSGLLTGILKRTN